MNGTLLTISCTPHFKDDAERPWITQDSITSVSLWFNPGGGSTLEDIAETIENFVRTMPGYSHQIASCSLQSLTVRGEVFRKNMMSSYMAGDKLHDLEPFTVQVKQTISSPALCCTIL